MCLRVKRNSYLIIKQRYYLLNRIDLKYCDMGKLFIFSIPPETFYCSIDFGIKFNVSNINDKNKISVDTFM